MKEFFNKYSSWIIAIFIGIIVFFWVYFNRMIEEKQKKIDEMEYVDTSGTYHKIYYEKKYKELKVENKALYDSLKQYKNKLDYIVQFYHEKEYNTGQVTTKPNIKDSIVYDTVPVTIPQIARTYEYTSEPNDTNHITISPDNGGSITNPTVWKKNNKRTFWDRFSFGPGVTAGYDPINKQFGIVVGASATFDLK